MNVKRLVLYLLLNIIVSAAVAFGVLWLWDKTHPLVNVPPAAVVVEAVAHRPRLRLVDVPDANGTSHGSRHVDAVGRRKGPDCRP